MDCASAAAASVRDWLQPLTGGGLTPAAQTWRGRRPVLVHAVTPAKGAPPPFPARLEPRTHYTARRSHRTRTPRRSRTRTAPSCLRFSHTRRTPTWQVVHVRVLEIDEEIGVERPRGGSGRDRVGQAAAPGGGATQGCTESACRVLSGQFGVGTGQSGQKEKKSRYFEIVCVLWPQSDPPEASQRAIQLISVI